MIHLYFHNITIFEELVRKETNPARGARHDSSTFPQSCAPREMSNDLLHGPDHVVSGGLLLEFSVDSGPEVQLLRIRNDTRGCNSCTDRSKPVK